MITLVKNEALNRRIFISDNLQADIPPVYGDRIQIQQSDPQSDDECAGGLKRTSRINK